MTAQSANTYQMKLERLDKSARLEKVDRVPIGAAVLYFPAKYSNITYEEMLFDNDKYVAAATKFAVDFDWDATCFLRTFETVPLGLSLANVDPELAIQVATASVVGGGFAHDILKDNYSKHPGREFAPNSESQFIIESPLMEAEEYEALLENPLDYLSEKILPRIYNSLSKPGTPTANRALIKLGYDLNTVWDNVAKFTQKMKEVNCPPYYMALAPNPLDFLGSFLRNFDQVIFDLRRYPDKIKKFCDELAPIFLAVGKATGQISYELTGSRRVFMPVFYNSLLSKSQYEEFLWPYIKYIAEGLIEDGFTPLISFQGEHDHLLDTILELPEKKAIIWFDRTELVDAQKVVGGHSCIAGGISPSILISGTPTDVDAKMKEILVQMKKTPGFIFTLPIYALGSAKEENVRAMTEAILKYGEY